MDNKAFDVPSEIIKKYENSEIPFAINAENVCIAYANKTMHRLLNLPYNYDMAGRYMKDIPCAVSEFHNELQYQDQEVMSTQVRKVSLEIHNYTGNNLEFTVSEKVPLLNTEGDPVGVLCHIRTLKNFPNIIAGSGSFILNKPSDFFSDIEWDIVYLLQSRTPYKIIARILGTTDRIIRRHIEVIYSKSRVCNVNQLIDLSRSNGWDRYIPQKFITRGHTPLF